MATNNFNWPAKPDNPVLNRAHPLAQKLILDVNYVARGGKSEIERVTGAGTAMTGTTAGVSNNGSVRVFPGGTATDVDAVTDRGLFADPNRITLECVVLLNTGGGNGLGRIVDGPFFLNYQDSNNSFNFFQPGWGSVDSQSFSGFNPPSGTWFHLVMVYDSSTLSNLPHFYVNGVLQADGGFNTQPSGTPPADSFNNPVLIGNNAASGGARSLNGQISYVRLWNRILSLGEIRALFANPWQIYQAPAAVKPQLLPSPAATVGIASLGSGGKLPFSAQPDDLTVNYVSELAQGLVFDANYAARGGTGNTELISGTKSSYGGAPLPAPIMGPHGPMMLFPGGTGTNSTVDTYTTPASVNNLNRVTVEAFFIPFGAGGGSNPGAGRVMQKGSSSVSHFQVQWVDNVGTGEITWLVYWNAGAVQANWSTNANSAPVGVPCHLVVTYDNTSASNAPQIWINGVSQTVTVGTSPSGTSPVDDTVLTIGNRDAGDRPIDAAISYVRLYNRILVPQEIQALYANPWQIYRAPAAFISAPLTTAYVLAAGQGAFALTGEVVALKAARMMLAAQGNVGLTGEPATLRHGYIVAAVRGAFAQSGEAVAFGITMPGPQGAFALTGEAVSLIWTPAGGHYVLSTTIGSFTLAGEPLAFKVARKFGVLNGVFNLTGEAAGLVHGRVLGAARGTYALTGEPVAIHVALSIKAQCGTLVLAGGRANLLRSGWTTIGPSAADWVQRVPGASGWSPAASDATFWTPRQ